MYEPPAPYFKGTDKDGNQVKVEYKLNNPKKKKARCQWLYRVMVGGVQLVQVDSIYFEDTSRAIAFVNDIAMSACETRVTKDDADKMKSDHQKRNYELYEKRLKDPTWCNKAVAEHVAEPNAKTMPAAKVDHHGIPAKKMSKPPPPKVDQHGIPAKKMPKRPVKPDEAPPMVYSVVDPPTEETDKPSAKASNGYAKAADISSVAFRVSTESSNQRCSSSSGWTAAIQQGQGCRGHRPPQQGGGEASEQEEASSIAIKFIKWDSNMGEEASGSISIKCDYSDGEEAIGSKSDWRGEGGCEATAQACAECAATAQGCKCAPEHQPAEDRRWPVQ